MSKQTVICYPALPPEPPPPVLHVELKFDGCGLVLAFFSSGKMNQAYSIPKGASLELAEKIIKGWNQ